METYTGNRAFLRRPSQSPLSCMVLAQHGRFLVAHSDALRCSLILDLSSVECRKIRMLGAMRSVKTYEMVEGTETFASLFEAEAEAMDLDAFDGYGLDYDPDRQLMDSAA